MDRTAYEWFCSNFLLHRASAPPFGKLLRLQCPAYEPQTLERFVQLGCKRVLTFFFLRLRGLTWAWEETIPLLLLGVLILIPVLLYEAARSPSNIVIQNITRKQHVASIITSSVETHIRNCSGRLTGTINR